MAFLRHQKMEKYQHRIKVQQEHLDDLKHVNNVIYLQWVQDIAAKHWFARAGKESGVIWVVRKHSIEYFNAAHLNDDLDVQTWVISMSGLISKRKVVFYREESLICECVSDWVMLDAQSFKPKRIPEELAALF
ncbi:MAG: thioesterase [Bacteroidetes bacterium]|nr:thioesterase [Bacteroidota bacterium]